MSRRTRDTMGWCGSGVASEGDERPWVHVVHADYPLWSFDFTFDTDGSVAQFTMRRVDRSSAARYPAIKRAWARGHPPELTARVLHAVPFGELSSFARSHLVAVHDGHALAWATHPELRDQAMVLSTWVSRLRDRPGRAGRRDLDYALVAREYVDLLGTPKPIDALRKRLNLSPSRTRGLLNEARRRELLSAAPSGRAGGALTRRAVDLLADYRED